MNSFIGKSLNLLIEYCNKNRIKYVIYENSFSDNQNNECENFVTGIAHHDEFIEIIVSKFKIEV